MLISPKQVNTEKFMSPVIAITGATGFIGGVLAKRLVSEGLHIRALVRPSSYRKLTVENSIEWIKGELEDINSLRCLVSGADIVVHCAGAVRGTCRRDFDRVNVDGVKKLVQAATGENPKPCFLLMSSLAAREPHLSHYTASKHKGEKILVSTSGKMPWSIFRPCAVYGPGDREMLPIFQWMARGIAPVIGYDHNRISLLFVEDLAEAVIHWMHCGVCSRRIYELDDGYTGGYTWRDIINAVAGLNNKSILRIKIPVFFLKIVALFNLIAARIMGFSPMLSPGKVKELTYPDWVADNTAFRRDTGWTPKVTLKKGLKRTLK